MATIGFRFEDLSTAQPKRSFFQRMNDSHGTFLSQIRSKKGSTAEERRQAHIERSRMRSASSQSRLSEASTTSMASFSTLASSVADRSQESDSQEEPEFSPRDSSSRQSSGDYGAVQYANMPRDRDHRRNVVQGMQSLLHWKQASYDASVVRPFHISPPQTPTTSHSWSSSISLSSDMSDEQVEQWLERPIDAEMHRSRKSSAASSTTSVESKFNVEEFGIKEYRRRKDSHAPSVTISIPELDEVEHEEDIKHQDADATPLQDGGAGADTQSPDNVLQELGFLPLPRKVDPLRFSCLMLDNFDAEALRT